MDAPLRTNNWTDFIYPMCFFLRRVAESMAAGKQWCSMLCCQISRNISDPETRGPIAQNLHPGKPQEGDQSLSRWKTPANKVITQMGGIPFMLS